MDIWTWLAGLIGSCGLGLGVGCLMICRDHMRRIANLEIIIAEKVIGSGLAGCRRQSDSQQSAGHGDGRARSERMDQAVESGVQAYRQGYRPF